MEEKKDEGKMEGEREGGALRDEEGREGRKGERAGGERRLEEGKVRC